MLKRMVLSSIKPRYNEYWGENIKVFKAIDFIAELTRHILLKSGALDPLLGPVFQKNKREGKQRW